MKLARQLAYAVMPAIFVLAMTPLAYFAYTKNPSDIFPSEEIQARLSANPAKQVAKAEQTRPSPTKRRPQLVLNISSPNIIVHKCSDDASAATTTALVTNP